MICHHEAYSPTSETSRQGLAMMGDEIVSYSHMMSEDQRDVTHAKVFPLAQPNLNFSK